MRMKIVILNIKHCKMLQNCNMPYKKDNNTFADLTLDKLMVK